MHRLSRQALALHFRALVDIERGEIFGPADAAYRPINLPEDSATMFAGSVRPNCESGRCLILAINPGGGGDTKADKIVGRRHTGSESDFCVPRTIGDTYISAEAERVLARIRSEFPTVGVMRVIGSSQGAKVCAGGPVQ